MDKLYVKRNEGGRGLDSIKCHGEVLIHVQQEYTKREKTACLIYILWNINPGRLFNAKLYIY